MTSVAIVGAGQMGGGIVWTVVIASYQVFLYDISAEQVEKSIATIKSNLAHQVASGKMDVQGRFEIINQLSAKLFLNALK